MKNRETLSSVSVAHTVFINSTNLLILLSIIPHRNNIILSHVKTCYLRRNSIFQRVCGKNKLFIYLFIVCLFVFLQSFRQYTEVWSRPLYDGSVAVVLFSRRHDQPYVIEAFFDEVLLR